MVWYRTLKLEQPRNKNQHGVASSCIQDQQTKQSFFHLYDYHTFVTGFRSTRPDLCATNYDRKGQNPHIVLTGDRVVETKAALKVVRTRVEHVLVYS